MEKLDHGFPPLYMQFCRKVIADLHYTTYFKKRDEGMSVQNMRDADYPDVDIYEAAYQKSKS